jgi:outer membrane protein TolC
MRPSFLLLSLIASIPALRAEGGLSLREAVDLARGGRESLAIRREEGVQSAARGRGALGGLFPRISWDWRDTHQDVSGLGDSFGGFIEGTQVESKFTAEQPLFAGLREYSAWRGFRQETVRDALRLADEERRLVDGVAGAYFQVLILESAQDNVRATQTLAEDVVKELRAFRRLGKARDGEVFSAETQAAEWRAQALRLEGDIASAREDLALWIGREVDGSLARPGADPVAAPLASFLERVADRPDVAAQRADLRGRDWRVRYEQGGFSPVLKLTGNYYTHRPTFFEPVNWDASLNLNVPLFQGGTVRARVAEARSQREQSRLALAAAEKQARSDVRRAYRRWSAAVAEAEARGAARQAAQKNYEVQRADYRLGLVTTLDVLQSLTSLARVKSDEDEARLRAARERVALDLAVGGNLP